ncbi:MAG: hypothetical protein KF809_06465 [Chloroflexi bacterium]|nr:hypothetical protein [Chloroflexota bacterium]
MAHDALAPQTTPPTASVVEASRAWILGLVVEPDGSITGPASGDVPEWLTEPDEDPSGPAVS